MTSESCFLPADLVVKAQFVGPDLIEDHPSRGGFEDLRLLATVNGILAEIGVLETDPTMGIQRVLGNGKSTSKRWKTGNRWSCLGAGILREIITAGISCEGVVIGFPLEGEKMLLGANISMRASS